MALLVLPGIVGAWPPLFAAGSAGEELSGVGVSTYVHSHGPGEHSHVHVVEATPDDSTERSGEPAVVACDRVPHDHQLVVSEVLLSLRSPSRPAVGPVGRQGVGLVFGRAAHDNHHGGSSSQRGPPTRSC